MSQPLGWNALLQANTPWKSIQITRVSVPASGTTLLPTTPLANRAGVYIWVPGTGESLRWGLADSTFDTSSPLAYAGAITPLPLTDQIALVGQSVSGTIVCTIIEYVI